MPKQLSSSTRPLDERVAAFIDQRWRILLALILLTSTLFIALTFDPKVSIGGDDSWYVLAAQDFWNGVAFPSWHGSFYSILLSPLIALLGISLVPLKLLSVLFTLVAVWLLAVSFRKHISPLTWLIGTALFALTPHLVTLASTTYSEPLFLLIQSAIFYTLFAYEAQTGATTKQKGLWLLLLAFLTFALAITRNVGYAAFLALLIYFLALRRDWHASVLYGAGFILLQVLFSVYRRLVWGVTDASFAGQLNRALQVDFYNASAGQEDLWGMLVRFAQNCKQYLSGHNMQFVGFPSATGSWVITLLVVVLLLFFLIRTWRRNRVLALLGIYLAAMYGITFITQQVAWNQMRLVLVYFPLFLSRRTTRTLESKEFPKIVCSIAYPFGYRASFPHCTEFAKCRYCTSAFEPSWRPFCRLHTRLGQLPAYERMGGQEYSRLGCSSLPQTKQFAHLR